MLERFSILVWVSILSCLISNAASAQGRPEIVLTNILQIRSLSSSEAAERRSVKLEATISYYDQPAGMMFIFDQTGGIFINPEGLPKALKVGDKLEVTGVAEAGSRLPFIAHAYVGVKNWNELPPAKKIDARLLASGVADSEWVQVEGIVRKGDGVIQIKADGQPLKLWLPKDGNSALPKLPLGSLVLVEGVGGIDLKDDGLRQGALFVPGPSRIRILRKGPSNPEALVNLSVEEIKQSPTLEGALVKMAGAVTGLTADGLLVVKDPTGAFRISSEDASMIRPGDQVEVIGFANLKSEIPLMENAQIRAFGPRLDAKPSDGSAGMLPILFETRAVKDLSKAETTNGWPVRLIGVITYLDLTTNIVAVQDATSGIFVFPEAKLEGLRVGQKVEVNGFSAPGRSSRKVVPAVIKTLGEGQLPLPVKAGFDTISSRKLDGEYIEARGVVRSVSDWGSRLKVELAMDDGLLAAYVTGPASLNDLIDCEVTISGVCSVRLATSQRPMENQIWLNDPNLISVLSRPSPDFHQIAITSAGELSDKPKTGNPVHRVHMQGEITAVAGNIIYLQDMSGAFVVQHSSPIAFVEGDVVDVYGFSLGGKLPNLQNVILEKTKQRRHVIPLHTTPERAGTKAGILLSLNGNLLQVQKRESDMVLVMRDGLHVFDAMLENPNGNTLERDLKPDSHLQLTGVCVSEYDTLGNPTSFHLVLRSAKDINVLKLPSWWTPKKLVVFLSVLFCCVMISMLWAATLRQRLESQTQLIKSRLEREVILETKLTRMVESSLIGIIFWDHKMRVVDANQAFLDMFGYRLEELTSSTGKWTDFAASPGGKRLLAELENLKDSGRCLPVEVEMKAQSGALLPVLVGAALVSTTPLAGVTYVLDRRGQRELEEQLRQAQKMESIGRLAGGVAHDFNNLLTVIKGHSAMLISSENLSAEENDSVREIIKSTERAGHLTRQLLTFSRKQDFQLRPVDLNEIIRNLTRMLSRIMGEDVTLHCSCQEKLPGVLADSGMIEQIVMNLAVNARDAMSEGGTLEIKTEVVPADLVRGKPSTRLPNDAYVCFSIKDNGTGMKDEVVKHLFEPFFTTKEVGKGTGLGLATVYGIVQSHQGWLDVETAPGKGTLFRIYLPALPGQAPVMKATPQEARPRGGAETILVVEDEPSLQRLIRSSLERHGYTIHAASSGPEALALWEKHGSEVDLLLTDMVMPNGISGKQLAEMLQEKNPLLKIIYSSGYSVDFTHDQSLVEGFNFVAKPYDPEHLARVVRHRLDGASSA